MVKIILQLELTHFISFGISSSYPGLDPGSCFWKRKEQPYIGKSEVCKAKLLNNICAIVHNPCHAPFEALHIKRCIWHNIKARAKLGVEFYICLNNNTSSLMLVLQTVNASTHRKTFATLYHLLRQSSSAKPATNLPCPTSSSRRWSSRVGYSQCIPTNCVSAASPPSAAL